MQQIIYYFSTFYMGAQFYPTFATMMPASVVLGICGAPLWIAKCTYVTHVSFFVQKRFKVYTIRSNNKTLS